MTPGTISDAVRARVHTQAGNRCGYCLTRQEVVALNLNNLIAVTVRRNWVAAGWHPPAD